MDQSIKSCLASPEDLSSIPRTQIKMVSLLVYSEPLGDLVSREAYNVLEDDT